MEFTNIESQKTEEPRPYQNYASTEDTADNITTAKKVRKPKEETPKVSKPPLTLPGRVQ